MLKEFVITLICLFTILPSNGQEVSSVQSLKQKVQVEKDPETKAKFLYDIGNFYLSKQRDSSIFYLTQSYHIANTTTNLGLRSKVAGLLGSAYQVIDLEKSAVYLFEAVDLAEQDGDKYLISHNYNILGTHYRVIGDLDLAGDYYKKAIKLNLELQDSSGMAFCYNNLGIVHMMKSEYEEGLELWMQSLETKLLLGDSIGATNTMSNIGIYYEDIGRTEEALEYFNEGLKIELTLNVLDHAANSYAYLGDLHSSSSDYAKAIESYKKSIQLMDSIGMIFDKREPLLNLSHAYEKSNNYRKAYETLISYQELNAVYQDSAKSESTRELGAKYESDKKEKENALLKSANDTKDARIKEEEAKIALKEANNRYLWIGLGLVFIILILIVFALRRVRNAKLEIETQKLIVDEKNKEITDSIAYAKRLQTAILPTNQAINNALQHNFVLYLPKDIVAGDFYWMERIGNKVLFAVADCTGHGVPGAFVSVVCHSALNRAVREFQLEKPSNILDKVTDLVIETFEKSEEDVKDGMDIALCALNLDNNILEYAGANNSLYYIRNGELSEIKATKQPVGKYDARKDFVNHTLQMNSADVFYLFTDGYADQFGGEKGKKYKYRNFKNLLNKVHQKNLSEQRKALLTEFEAWMGAHEQVDDVCLLGVKV